MKKENSVPERIVSWQKQCGRHHLPWQRSKDAYPIWLSEIMLQQTQVATVIPYFERFISRFPTLQSLAQAPLDDVLRYWSGLGYYARARNLHRCAQILVQSYGGEFPACAEQIKMLPGIGQSTAHAICAFAFSQRTPIMDGNVKRVFARFYGIAGDPQKSAVNKQFWSQAWQTLQSAPQTLDMAAYTQGLMDLGATKCTRNKPDCEHCPLNYDCYAKQHHLQNQLPTKKVKRAVAQRKILWLFLESPEAILLQKRPQTGIWGGLWSFMEFSTLEGLQQYLLNYGYYKKPVAMAPISHKFTHFELLIYPYHVSLEGSNFLSELDDNEQWVRQEELAKLGMPKPAMNFLESWYQMPNEHK